MINDLYRVNIFSNSSCQCGADFENLSHYFCLHCSITLIGYLLTVMKVPDYNSNDKLMYDQSVQLNIKLKASHGSIS